MFCCSHKYFINEFPFFKYLVLSFLFSKVMFMLASWDDFGLEVGDGGWGRSEEAMNKNNMNENDRTENDRLFLLT